MDQITISGTLKQTVIFPHQNQDPEIRGLWINKNDGSTTNSSNLNEMIPNLGTKTLKLKI